MAFRFGPAFIISIDRNGKRWGKKYATTTTYRNGDPIPQVTDSAEWAALTTGAWCWYNNDSANEATYGKLYNWYAATDPRGIAPYGYRIPKLNPTNFLNPLDSDFVSSDSYSAWGFAYESEYRPPPYRQTIYPGCRDSGGQFALIDTTVFFYTSAYSTGEDAPIYWAYINDENEIAGIDKNYGLTLWFVQN
jgi:uncharacterized protein (TIGR02145 family)